MARWVEIRLVTTRVYKLVDIYDNFKGIELFAVLENYIRNTTISFRIENHFQNPSYKLNLNARFD